MRKFFTFLCLLAALGASGKLTKFVLRGYIDRQDYSKTEWQRQAVDSVFVALVKNDTIPVEFKLLRGDDELKMATGGELRAMVQGGVGSYTLLLNREGYEPLRHDFKVASEGQDVVYLRGLSMEAKRENTLKEVEVVGTAIKMVMKGDTIVYDSAAFNLPEGSTLDALVRQLPGAHLEEDGSITVNGKKVQSLLLNGTDFFKGDPEVALKNLPSYTVDKIKVYDKAEKDDYLTLRSQTLANSPLDENIVMDVVLKREFSMATIFSLEGGYGPGIYSDGDRKLDSRYLGRTFIIGFGKTYRFSLYANANNIGNRSRASSYSKDWGWAAGESGDGNQTLAGVDFSFKPNDKLEAQAEMQYSREDMDFTSLSASTSFYPTGNLYSRSRTDLSRLLHSAGGKAGITYRGSNVYVSADASVQWTSSRLIRRSYVVNLDRNPGELTRGAVIDSVFSDSGMSGPLRRSITSATYTGYRNCGDGPAPSYLTANANLRINYTPRSIRGSFVVSGNMTDTQDAQKEGRLYAQQYTAAPLRNERWADMSDRITHGMAQVSYYREKDYVGDVRSNSLTIDAAAGWGIDRRHTDNVYHTRALASGFDPSQLILPSQVAAANAPVDPQNTVNSLMLDNRATGTLYLGWRNELVAPGDSSANLAFEAAVNLGYERHFRHLTYGKPRLDPAFAYRYNREDPTRSADVKIGLLSGNNLRYLTFSLRYRYSSSLYNLMSLVPTENSSDPLHIYLGPEDIGSFRSPSSHSFSVYASRYGEEDHSDSYAQIGATIDRNAQGYGSTFDPATGVTTSRPMNINGNWRINAEANHEHPFGPLESWNVNVNLRYTHNNSVDYLTAVRSLTPERSVVRNDDVTGGLALTYTIKRDSPFKGTGFHLGGRVNWEHAASPRADFRTISAWSPDATTGIHFLFPGGVEGDTRLTVKWRRGYQDSALNTTECFWNASVQKSILKGALTFKVNAVDLLGQVNRISYVVNAQGRTETWRNSMPRYVMLNVTYRFNYTPNALK